MSELTEQKHYVGNETGNNGRNCYRMNTRKIMWLLVFTGCAVNYLYRVNINIAIVNMIKIRKSSTNIQGVFECYNQTIQTLNVNHTQTTPKHGFSIERWFMDKFNIKYNSSGFDWDEYHQSIVLGAFFWLHFATALPGGVLARKYGTKKVYGVGNFVGILLCFVIPMATYISSSIYLLLFIRLIQGFFSGACYPSIHNLTAHWIPPNERSKFLTSYLGNSAGIAFFYPMLGFIMAATSWEWVFHVSGIIGVVWFIAWQYFIYDTPAKHPRINIEEKLFIEQSLAGTVQKTKREIPWLKILTSKQVWLILIAQTGILWGLVTMTAQAPTYFRFIHGYSVQMTGTLAGFPYLLRVAGSFLFSGIADYAAKHKLMSRTNIRKCGTFITTILNGCLYIGLAYCGCNSTLAVIIIMIGTICQSAHSTGVLAAMVDIAPNYASIIFGLSLFSLVTGFLSPYVVGVLTLNNQTTTQWKYIFMITGFILIGTGLPYIMFGDANIQSWNNPKEDSKKRTDDLESEALNRQND